MKQVIFFFFFILAEYVRAVEFLFNIFAVLLK